jgi:hypothetical protein
MHIWKLVGMVIVLAKILHPSINKKKKNLLLAGL